MTRRMSCSMTVDSVRARTKTVTRRRADSWRTLEPGDRLVLVEKAMGLPRGATQVVLAEVEIVDVRVESIVAFVGTTRGASEVAAEGFDPDVWGDLEWAAWWASGHGHRTKPWERGQLYAAWRAATLAALGDVMCRRIEWRYI